MTVEQVTEQLQSLGGAAEARTLVGAMKRLYEISLYEHHVPVEQRAAAFKLYEAIKADLEASLATNPEALRAVQDANQFMEATVRLAGIGSLGWLIEENRVPAAEIVPYIMRREHATLLADFLTTLDADTIQNVKPALVRELVLSRRPAGGVGAVALLHGLIANADPAAMAIFSAPERTALLGVPDDYMAGRAVLVALGLLPAEGDAPGFDSSLETSKVVAIVALISVERDQAARTDTRLHGRSTSRKEAALLALTMLRGHLARRLLRQVYGAEAEAAALAIHPDEGVRARLGWFEELARNAANLVPSTGIDRMLFIGVMEGFGVSIDTEEAYEHEKEWIELCAEWLLWERVEVLDLLRFHLRWLSNNSAPDAHVAPGSYAGTLEPWERSYFEDRIDPEE